MPSQPHDPPRNATNGHGDAARLARRPGRADDNGARPSQHADGATDGAQTTNGHTLADSEQTLSDSDQTLSDADQTSSDSDQTSADCDQIAADRDQAASDRDLASGVDEHEHDVSQEIRERSARRREQTGEARLDTARQRDEVAKTRDLAALAGDQAADARDRAIAQHDAAFQHEDGERALRAADIVLHAVALRARAAQHRIQSAKERALAAEDRLAAAQDREHAANERSRAATDPLTGARARAAGLTELEHEFDRCRRNGDLLIVAYVDVIGLKAVNDSAGHAAGDELLARIAQLMQHHLRSYDLVIRVGGDEFLCAMSNMAMTDAHRRFAEIDAMLAAAPQDGAIRTGFAELRPDETVAQLIARADGELIASRNRSQNGRRPHVDVGAEDSR